MSFKETRIKVGNSLDRIASIMTRIVMDICVLIFCVMVFSVSYGVIGRYINLVKAPRWTQELAILAMVWLCFLGSGYAIKEGLHVRMSVIEKIVGPKIARFLLYFAYVMLFAVNMVWVIYGAQIVELTSRSRMAATGWPMALTYLSLVIGGAYGALMVLARIVKGDLKK